MLTILYFIMRNINLTKVILCHKFNIKSISIIKVSISVLGFEWYDSISFSWVLCNHGQLPVAGLIFSPGDILCDQRAIYHDKSWLIATALIGSRKVWDWTDDAVGWCSYPIILQSVEPYMFHILAGNFCANVSSYSCALGGYSSTVYIKFHGYLLW